MASFFKNWTKHHKKGIKEKAKETLRIHGPSKPRIEIGNIVPLSCKYQNWTIELQMRKIGK